MCNNIYLILAGMSEWRTDLSNLQVGDLVLIEEDFTPPLDSRQRLMAVSYR